MHEMKKPTSVYNKRSSQKQTQVQMQTPTQMTMQVPIPTQMTSQVPLTKECLTKEIMMVDFALTELVLYLDTHPYDMRVLSLYNMYVKKSMMLRNTYQMVYGPLSTASAPSSCPWQWAEEPWPWEKGGN